jgi:glycosyltransferase involved in cell wall biosynthesis
MKVLHVETGRHFYGGPQQVIYLLRGLHESGVRTVLACVAESDIDKAARGLDIKVYNLPSAGDLDVTLVWWLRQIVRWETPDIMHCHSRRGADLLGGIAARLGHTPAVVSRRVDHAEPGFLAGIRYHPFCKVIAISENVADSLRESGVDDDRVTVIRSAVEFERFQASPARDLLQQFSLQEEDCAIASAGQLIARKGHRYLLEAMAGVVRSLPRVKLVVFGEGALEAELKEQAQQLGLAQNVRFAGFRNDLDDYLGAFDLVVHPALREGLGVSMLKAAAAGVPVVAFDVAGAREAVVNGRTGLLVTPKDSRALEQAMLQLLRDPALRRSLGEEARHRMRTEFSIDTMVDRHIQLYETILNGSG